MLGEPPRTAYDLNFSLFGIPVRISPWFWLAGVLLGSQAGKPVSVAILVVALLISILVHEFGHAAVVRGFGLHPWITLFGFGGLTSYDPRSEYRTRSYETWGQVLISVAGPAAGFLLVAFLWLCIVAAGHRQDIFPSPPWGLRPWVELPSPLLSELLNNVSFLSVVWGLVNLLPVYPLDGGQIAREIALRLSPREGIRYSLVLSIIAAIAMAVFGWKEWHDKFVVVFFGLLAYFNFTTLQAYSGQGWR
jgi:stage IV sporulation protein FB